MYSIIINNLETYFYFVSISAERWGDIIRNLHCYQTLADLLLERNLERQAEVARLFHQEDIQGGYKRADRIRRMLRRRLQLDFRRASQPQNGGPPNL